MIEEFSPAVGSLRSAWQAHPGDPIAALQAANLDAGLDEDGNVVQVGFNQFDDSDLELLAQLPHLVELRVRGSAISDAGLAALADLTQLSSLWLDADQLTDGCFAALAELRALEELVIMAPGITGRGVGALRQLPALRALSFTDGAFGDSGLAELAKFHQLERLRLFGTAVSDAGMAHVARCPLLVGLDLNNTAVTDRGVAALIELPQLVELKLDGSRVTPNCLPALRAMRQLKWLDIGDGWPRSAIDQLKSAGVEVSHGHVTEVMRHENFLHFRDTMCAVAPLQSSFNVRLNRENHARGPFWQLELRCSDAYVPRSWTAPRLSSEYIYWDQPWRELEGQGFEMRYHDSEVLPLTDRSAGYFSAGEPMAPNDHLIHLEQRRGRWFTVRWACKVKQNEGDAGEPVCVLAEVPFNELAVFTQTEQPLSNQEAIELARRYFDLREFEPPVRRPTQIGTYISFAVRAMDVC